MDVKVFICEIKITFFQTLSGLCKSLIFNFSQGGDPCFSVQVLFLLIEFSGRIPFDFSMVLFFNAGENISGWTFPVIVYRSIEQSAFLIGMGLFDCVSILYGTSDSIWKIRKPK
ncbi:MAG: hypothetical protein C4522_09800 [Desulfobacteraceae bacterium]|nr:MAG: hypothetical protein C4522_09800 [Desulfobacteraceae bacterium]